MHFRVLGGDVRNIELKWNLEGTGNKRLNRNKG